MVQCRKFIVSGRVQGVFYRVSTQRRAMMLNVTGLVRNRADGSVEVIACGSAAQLDALLTWLWLGPEQAVVADVVSELIEEGLYKTFEVR